MKKARFSLLIALAAFSLSVMGCGEGDPPDGPPPKTDTETFTISGPFALVGTDGYSLLLDISLTDLPADYAAAVGDVWTFTLDATSSSGVIDHIAATIGNQGQDGATWSGMISSQVGDDAKADPEAVTTGTGTYVFTTTITTATASGDKLFVQLWGKKGAAWDSYPDGETVTIQGSLTVEYPTEATVAPVEDWTTVVSIPSAEYTLTSGSGGNNYGAQTNITDTAVTGWDSTKKYRITLTITAYGAVTASSDSLAGGHIQLSLVCTNPWNVVVNSENSAPDTLVMTPTAATGDVYVWTVEPDNNVTADAAIQFNAKSATGWGTFEDGSTFKFTGTILVESADK